MSHNAELKCSECGRKQPAEALKARKTEEGCELLCGVCSARPKADWEQRALEAEAKVAEQCAYIDLLVKAGKGSEDYAERVLSGVRAEIARTNSDLSLAYRLEEFLALVAVPVPQYINPPELA